eukprot:gene22276-42536_t
METLWLTTATGERFGVTAFENPVGGVGTAPSANHLQRGSLAGSTSSATSLDGIRFRAQEDIFAQSQSALFETAFASASGDAIVSADLLNTVLTASPAITTVFPNTSAGNQLKMAARLIGASPTLGLKRQVFFVQLGGWDTHAAQLVNTDPVNGTHAGLLAQISQAVNAFYN